MAPSTFASAAAGNTSNPSGRDGTSEWSRRPNGATQTFRRPSGATTTTATTSHVQPDAATPNSTHPMPRYVPPHRNGPFADSTRYTKEQLLEMGAHTLSAPGARTEGLSQILMPGWLPNQTNGVPTARGRTEQPGPDACWISEGTNDPLGFTELNDEERELFTTSVNTPLKPPIKDGQGRKASAAGVIGRRRDTSDSFSLLGNSLPSPAIRDEGRAPSPPPALQRRRTDLRDSARSEDRSEGDDKHGSLGSVKRNPLSAGLTGSPSPWSNSLQNPSFAPMGSFGNFGGGQAGEKRPGLGGGRVESRFKTVLNKDSGEELSSPLSQRKPSVSGPLCATEKDSWRLGGREANRLVEDDEGLPSGSAALAGLTESSQELQPTRGGHHRAGTRSRAPDEFGFGTFGMTADNVGGLGGTFAGHHQAGQRHQGALEPLSPTDTNPYRSPEQRLVSHLIADDDDGSEDLSHTHLAGLGTMGGAPEQAQQFGGLSGLGSLSHFQGSSGSHGAPGDSSQSSSVAGHRNYAPIGGLGHVGSGAFPWQPGAFATQSRPAAGVSRVFGGGMGGGLFASSMAEMQSPALAGLGTPSPFSSQSAGGYGSRVTGAMSLSAMQEPARHDERDSAFSMHGVEEQLPTYGANGSSDQGQQQSDPGASSDDASGGLPSASSAPQQQQQQQRVMVMPDRMRWIYRDPQGNKQGPWSGLEMHDWYKAGFFTRELLVKRLEDPDYEPLAQMIRRIGNSREPFLVPQIGIPHGPPSSNGAGPNAWAGGANGGSSGNGTAQPPFAGSFPSFGTTLTAEQQNALERRKQEEQYLIARQKEHLARMQHVGTAGLPHPALVTPSLQGQLHHQGSVQSLHSQPSYGSITNPAYQPSPIQAPTPGGLAAFYDAAYRAPMTAGGLGPVGGGLDSLAHIREEALPGLGDGLTVANRAHFGAPGQPFTGSQPQQSYMGAPDAHTQRLALQDRVRLQQEQAEHDARQTNEEPIGVNERMREFHQLQGTTLNDRFSSIGATGTTNPQETMSLTDQVKSATGPQSSHVDANLPQPFPPAPSQSPLPAPAAQRASRGNVADQLQQDSSEPSYTPSEDNVSSTPAPWAKESSEAPKGPSLKAIQEIEAKKAAEAEAAAAAARRAAQEKRMELHSSVVTQPGLPAAASWASASPATPTSGSVASPWAKAPPKATNAPTKTLAQIQKEEEARKRQMTAASADTARNVPTSSKSYATLASKPTAGASSQSSGAWTTVGASGKTKGPVTAAPAATYAAPTSTTNKSAPAKRLVTRPANVKQAVNSVDAMEELRKWALAELGPDLRKGMSGRRDELFACLNANYD
ncbi:hypothetical protein K470DRAFT_256709 [Piedraia hortae CBS 480.64]|uniref:GYF domain-containing protein n=1 Tax=Piedraia hortae CBS 480.64 TaxID=1314780 RepID=A0A6A7C2U8_9PEZI|nr:hypothetical protein K470DRAFT_256709 [Piedraia hortae CBS 480.64]